MFFSLTSNVLLAADEINGADVFSRFIQGKAPLYDVPKALDDLWYIAMQGSLYKLVSFLGLFIAVLAVGFWCVRFYMALEEGTMKPVMSQLVWPVIIVLLLANGGSRMRDVTMGTRNILNAVNYSVSEVIGAEVNIRTMFAAIVGNYELEQFIGGKVNLCNEIVDYPKYLQCMNGINIAADLKVGKYTRLLRKNLPPIFQTKLDRWADTADRFKTRMLTPKTPQDSQTSASQAAINSGTTGAGTSGAANPSTASTGSSASLPAGFDPLNAKSSAYTTEDGLNSVIRVLTSTKMAFLYILESMMLVTGLIGPIFVALSLFPVGTKPMVAWAVSFLTIGFCKICYNLISGIATIAMVYAGPENSDMAVASVVLGLFAPVLSFVVASNSGFSALSTVTTTAQGFGLNAGISSYTIGTGTSGGNTNNPKSSPSASGGGTVE
jgi:hypothetical protein